ncbi:amino acid ABC transporter ATP-binding protein [Microbacterium marinilacus]|nr:amino acid ABC transporter ATP-binding protein [Microbacterium marinilacus]
MLRIRDVWKSFDGHDVLRGIDLDVAPGEVVALIGASGSGKSTLLRTVNLLEPIDDGRILLHDLDISDPRVDADAVRARIGVVFQQYNLFPHLTAQQNIALALRHVRGMRRRDADAAAVAALARVGLSDKASAHPDRLSGGQQQRVALARAVVGAPELLLLDEITSALDPELVGEVLDLVRTLADDGATIVMATHEMAFARDVADRVVFLDGGRIVEQGAPSDVLVSPREERTRAFLSRFLD